VCAFVWTVTTLQSFAAPAGLTGQRFRVVLPISLRNSDVDSSAYPAPVVPSPTATTPAYPAPVSPGYPVPAVPTASATAQATAVATATRTPQPTATVRPTSTPTPIPSCNTRVETINGGSFSSWPGSWLLLRGLPVRSSLIYWSPAYSLYLGGYNSANDLVAQGVVVPAWAETGTLTFNWTAYSDELLAFPFDVMAAQVLVAVGGDTSNPYQLTATTLDNRNSTRSWYARTSRFSVPSFVRGQVGALYFGAVTDASRASSFWIDDVSLTFACGNAAADIGTHDTVREGGRPATGIEAR
jgi:hypothetical protein